MLHFLPTMRDVARAIAVVAHQVFLIW